jgi:4-amino-4-deoxy-L-arabinose transferase-like glycosyltransferase
MKRKYFEIGAVIILLLFSMGLRLNTPRADIPHDISFSGSIYTDEGNQCHNSRSKILYNEWYPDDWRIKNYNPVVPYVKYGIFKIFGVGMTQVRAVSHIFAFLSLLFFFLTLRSFFNFAFSMLGTLLLGINYFFIMFNKIGTFETPMIFWMILSLFFMEKFHTTQKSYLLVLAGMSAFMSFVFKNTGAHFIFVPAAAYVLLLFFGDPSEKTTLKKGIKNVTLILGGVFAVFLLWLVFFYIPNREWIMSAPGKYIGNQMLPQSLKEAVSNFFGFNWKDQFYKMPIVWFSALLFVPLFFRRLLRYKANLTEIGFFLLFLSHTLFFFFMSNRPTRYLVPVIPAMVFMTTLLFERMYRFSLEKSAPPSYKKWEYGALLALDIGWLSLGLNFCFIPLYSRYIHGMARPPLTYKYFLFSLFAVLVFYLLKSLYWKMLKDKFSLKIPLKVLFVVMLGISLFINMKYYLKWNSEKTYSVLNISNELREKLDHAYIMGLTSPVAVLENTHKSLFLYPNFVQWEDDIFNRYPLTHALIANVHGEIRMYFDQWPQKMSNANLLKVYNVKDQFLHLYSFEDPYISGWSEEDGSFRVTIMNPGNQPVETQPGKVFHSSNPECSLSLEQGRPVQIQPGENTIPVVMDIGKLNQLNPAPETVIFYLKNDKWGNRFRYEGEKFPRWVGGDKRDLSASSGFVRSYVGPVKKGKKKPGFISFNPNFPLPFSQGLVKVDFHLKFSKIKSKLQPLCKIDIFPHREEEALAFKELKARHVKENQFGDYTLCAVVPETKFLEFRVYAEGFCDIELDYIDVTYYQGPAVQIKKGN